MAELAITTNTHAKLLALARRLKRHDSDVRYPMAIAPQRSSVIPSYVVGGVYHRQDDDNDAALPTPPRDRPSSGRSASESESDGRGSTGEGDYGGHGGRQGRGVGVYDGIVRVRDFVRRYM